MDAEYRAKQKMLHSLNTVQWYDDTVGEIEARDKFDCLHGTDTEEATEIYHMSDIDLTIEVLQNYRAYGPTPVRTVESMLSKVDIRHEDSVFVDFGSGKGRVLLIASHYPYRKVIGVEVSPTLCAVSRNNWRLYPSSKKGCSEIEICCQSAPAFHVPVDASVFYFFEPFSEAIMCDVLSNIVVSLAAHPRQIRLISIGRRLNLAIQNTNAFSLLRNVKSPDHPHFDGFIYANHFPAKPQLTPIFVPADERLSLAGLTGHYHRGTSHE